MLNLTSRPKAANLSLPIPRVDLREEPWKIFVWQMVARWEKHLLESTFAASSCRDSLISHLCVSQSVMTNSDLLYQDD